MADNTNSNSPSEIKGHVFSVKGTPLGGVAVICNDRNTSTIADGGYHFSNLTAGTYTLTARLMGYEPQSMTVTLPPEKSLSVDFHLRESVGSARIYGHIYDGETGKPVTSGMVILILPSRNRYSTLDHEGYYEFRRLWADQYEIVVSADGYVDESSTIEVSEAEVKERDFRCKPKKDTTPPWG